MNALLAPLLLVSTALSTPQSATEALLAKRAQEVVALIAPEPKWADDLFDPLFLKNVPPAKLRKLCSDLFAQFGAVESMPRIESTAPLTSKYDATFANGTVIPVTLGLSSTAPNSIVTLWFGAPAPGLADLPSAVELLKKLPGHVSFGVYELADKELIPLVEHEADHALAIGSAFKLYVLGALVTDVEQGKHRPEDIVRLEARYCSMPSGRLQTWPRGSPLTLHTLASLMISESDNTATDHLLFALGRERVERMLGEMSNASAARNTPFLSTGEMFRLKLTQGGAPAGEYLAREPAARRAYLEQDLAKLSLEPQDVDLSLLAKPSHIDTIEWFASARDLCRAMDWLRKATESQKTAPLRAILGINPGLDVSKERFDFIGYKGGSEPGVLNLTYLLRAKSGKWYALSCGWNDPENALEEQKLLGIVTRTLSLVGKPTKEAAK